MKFGITFANSGPFAEPEAAVALARAAEDLGYESLWTVEHVVVPAGYETPYPYSKTGKMPGGDQVAITDPLVWLSFVAAHTTRITLATGILILPQRNPVVLAKECATLDRLSGGRLVLGVGVGWLREEFVALGIPFEDRAARTDEWIAALRTLWREEEPTFHGRFASFERAISSPKPARPQGIPIVVGGHSDAAARRAGRLGDGFFPARANLEETRRFIGLVRASATEHGRDPDSIEITAGGARDLDAAKRFADAGVSRLVVPPLAFDAEGLRRQLGEYADAVVSRMST